MHFPPGFAILDLETTGLRPKTDRVVEIAIIRTDARGQPLAELSSLVDPERGMDATSIHGITSADVREAPAFRDLAGSVTHLLRGAVLVSHNFRFDKRFLLTEFSRLGHKDIDPVGLCTLEMSGEYVDLPWGRSLRACCHAIGVNHNHAHHALSDARSAGALFAHCRQSAERSGEDFVPAMMVARRVLWPELAARRGPVPREVARYQQARTTSHVAALVHRLPAGASSDPDSEAYLAKLDEILEDRMVTADEGAALHELALELGVSSGDLPRLHFSYLRDLARFALMDRVVTPEERSDLEAVARLLGFPPTAAEAALEAAKNAPNAIGIAERRPLEKGMLVCFSENELDRGFLTRTATEAGLIPRTAVSKKTDLVVTADPLSKSAKLEKARSLGKRILLESLFVKMLEALERPAAPEVAPLSESSAAASWPPGWYVDPWGQPCFRFWDGVRWTEHMGDRTG